MDYRRVIKQGAKYLLAMCVGFVLGVAFFGTPKPLAPMTFVDTIYRDKPVPYKVETTKIVNIPQHHFVIFNDTVQVPIEKVVYKEKEFEATISGITIGNIRPTLDNIVIYDNKRLFSPYATVMLGKDAFSIGGGVTIQEKHGLGVEYLNFRGESVIGWRYTYNF